MKAEIKEWFEGKLATELNLPRLYRLNIFCGIKETEKAVYAIFHTGYDASGNFGKHRAHWIPKSAIENLSDLPMIADYDEAIRSYKSEYDM